MATLALICMTAFLTTFLLLSLSLWLNNRKNKTTHNLKNELLAFEKESADVEASADNPMERLQKLERILDKR